MTDQEIMERLDRVEDRLDGHDHKFFELGQKLDKIIRMLTDMRDGRRKSSNGHADE